MVNKKFNWKKHNKWIAEFADAVIVYPKKKEDNKKKEKKNDTKSNNKNTKHNR